MPSYSVSYDIRGTAFRIIEADNEEELEEILSTMLDHDFEINSYEVIHGTQEIEEF